MISLTMPTFLKRFKVPPPRDQEPLAHHMLRTYRNLRRWIVIVTTVFLVALVAYKSANEDYIKRNSISAYYHHDNRDFPMGNLFVAALATAGFLLITYQGYRDRESLALTIAGFALLGVVAFPMSRESLDSPKVTQATPARDEGAIQRRPTYPIDNPLHYSCAIVFFFGLAYVSLYRSHDTLGMVRSDAARRWYRNAYRTTGSLMLAIPILAIMLYLLFKVQDTIFWIELVGIVAFLAYWVVKTWELEMTQGEAKVIEEAITGNLPAAPTVLDPR
jgi:uncharacterized membrane protein